MKRLFMLLLCLVTGTLLNAQTGYRGFVEGGSSIVFGDFKGKVYQFSTSHGASFGPMFVGIGVGYDSYLINNPRYDSNASSEGHMHTPDCGLDEAWIKDVRMNGVPLFLNVKYADNERSLSPLIDAKFGYADLFDMFSGLMYEAGIGCRYSVSDNFALNLAVFVRTNSRQHKSCERITGSHFSNAGLKLSFDF